MPPLGPNNSERAKIILGDALIKFMQKIVELFSEKQRLAKIICRALKVPNLAPSSFSMNTLVTNLLLS
jgi:hypothetical protein